MRPDLAAQFTKLKGKTPGEFFGTFEYTHKKSGRRVVSDVFPFHNWAFQEGLLHAENLGGDIELMLNKRALIGAFPWRYEGLGAAPAASSRSSMPATTSRRSAMPRRRSWAADRYGPRRGGKNVTAVTKITHPAAQQMELANP